MTSAPRWFVPVVVVLLLWNLIGCAAYLSDISLGPEDVARMSPAEQALYASRPVWASSATAIAVWGGAAGCVALLLRRRTAVWLLIASLVGVIGQDVSLFGLSGAGPTVGPSVFALQGLVLLVSIGLVGLAARASKMGWLA